MWQTLDLANKVNPLLIDNQTVRYNLSAWLGGYGTQDDNAAVSLIFIDSNNQLVGNATIIGRGNQKHYCTKRLMGWYLLVFVLCC
jgi:hypothetical protein